MLINKGAPLLFRAFGHYLSYLYAWVSPVSIASWIGVGRTKNKIGMEVKEIESKRHLPFHLMSKEKWKSEGVIVIDTPPKFKNINFTLLTIAKFSLFRYDLGLEFLLSKSKLKSQANFWNFLKYYTQTNDLINDLLN